MSKVCSSHNLSSLDALINDLDLHCVALEIFVKAFFDLNSDAEDYSRYKNALDGLLYIEMEALNSIYKQFDIFRDCLQSEKDF